MDGVGEVCGAVSLIDGLGSLRKIPSASVDFLWSNAVLPYVRRNQFVLTLQELRRIQRHGGVASHAIPIKDIIGGELNDFWVGAGVLGGPLLWASAFFTQRLRYLVVFCLFCVVGFQSSRNSL